MTLPVLRAVGTSASYGGANGTVPKPSGVVSGDLMLAFLEADGNIGVADWSTLTPAGWTILYQELTGGSFTWWPMVAYKVAGGSEPASYAFSFGTQSGKGIIVAWSGVSNATPINASAQQINTTSSVNLACPSITATVGDCLLVSGYFRRAANGNAFTPPAGMTGLASLGGGTSNASFGMSSLNLASTAGATGVKTATSATADTSYGVSIALTPAVAASTPSDLTGNVTLDNAVAAGTLTSIASSLSGNVTLDDAAAAGALGLAPGTLTTPALKNNTGTLLASVAGIVANIYNATTGAFILRKTGLTSSGAGVVTITDTALVSGTAYAYEIDLTAASLGRILPVGTAA